VVLLPPLLLQAIKAGNTLYVSGQIGIVPGTKDFASEGVEGQTEQVMSSWQMCMYEASPEHPVQVSSCG
jgi:enamine deaminase RidA (YjgF/YER057c/UK114 family)